MGTSITFKRPDGKEAHGYLANAAKGNAPGVVVIQEWWGLQDQIKGICDRFAAAGYEALAPDLYGGTVVPYHDTDAANREMSSLNFLEATDQLVQHIADRALVGDLPLDAFGHQLQRVLDVLLEVAIRRTARHGADRTHAAIGLVGAALPQKHFTGGLVGTGQQRADHRDVRAGRERLRQIA